MVEIAHLVFHSHPFTPPISMSNIPNTSSAALPPPGFADDLLCTVLLLPNAIVYATDAEGILTYTEGRGLAGIGVKPGDGVGEHIGEFFHYSSATRVNIMKVLKGEPLVTTTLIRGRYFEHRFTPAYDSNGNVTGLVGIIIAATERHQSDEMQFVHEELLYNLFDSIPEITHVLDRDLRIILANRSSRKMFPEGPLIGAHCYKVVTGSDAPCGICPVLKMYETGLPEHVSWYDEQRDRYQELYCYPVRDQAGNLIGAVETAYDVTEKRKVQEALNKSEALLHNTFASISDGIFVVDQNYTILRANPAMEALYAEHMPLIGKKCFVTSCLDRVCPNCPTEKMFEYGKPVTTEHYEQPTGTKPGMWLDHTAYPIFDKITGEIIGAIGVIRDVTERKQVELELQNYRTELEQLVDRRTHELKLSEARLRSILETSSAPITVIDWQGNVTYVNKAFQKLFGFAESEFLGHSALLNSEGNEEDHQSFWDLLNGKINYKRLTTRFFTKDGQTVWVDISASVVRGTDPTETQLICVIVDVTERQQILEESQRAKAAAEDASQAKSQFLATMSHEIRTPLNGVIGLSDLLLTTPLQSKQLEYAKLIKASGNTLLFLINDILDFSKIEAGKFELESIEFELHDLVESVMGVLASKANEQNLELAVTFEPNVPHLVRGDAGRLRQVLINLVGNGLKFTRTGGVRIHVSNEKIRDNDVLVRFEVIDNGIGIPEERLSRLFKPFSQVDASSARVYGGTGLGLAICKKLVELMDGTIGVRSVEGKGSTFWLCVPFECSPVILQCLRSSTPLCVMQDATVCPQTQNITCLSGRHHRVDLRSTLLADVSTLTVSANEIQRLSIKTQFIIWGLAAQTASSVAEAWELLNVAIQRKTPYRLIVVDTELDDDAGSELIDRILRDDRLADLAIVGLIPLSAESNNEFFRKKGVHFLTKPVYCSALFDAIATTLFKKQISTERAESAAIPTTKTFSPTQSVRSPLRVLVAEDNRINQIVIVETLSSVGMECKVAVNGREACDAVEHESFDVVLMDCQMPKMDGYEATAKIRSWEQSRPEGVRRLPIIALTANATKGDAEKCLAAGMDAYCSKPIDPKQVVKLIEQWATKTTT